MIDGKIYGNIVVEGARRGKEQKRWTNALSSLFMVTGISDDEREIIFSSNRRGVECVRVET